MLRNGIATFELDANQIAGLLGRNPYLGITISNAIESGVPDLSQGYSFTDSVYGNVLISVDASGQFHYIGQSPINPTVVNQPPYQSPSGNTLSQVWVDIQNAISAWGHLLLGGLAIYAVISWNRKS